MLDGLTTAFDPLSSGRVGSPGDLLQVVTMTVMSTMVIICIISIMSTMASVTLQAASSLQSSAEALATRLVGAQAMGALATGAQATGAQAGPGPHPQTLLW